MVSILKEKYITVFNRILKMQIKAEVDRIFTEIKKIALNQFYLSSYKMRCDVAEFYENSFHDMQQTIDLIIEKKMSISRFGDGELRLIFNPFFNVKFQKNSPEIAVKLEKVLTLNGYDKDKIIIGLPSYLPADIFQNVLYSEIWPSLRLKFKDDIVYGSTHVTRPLFFSYFKNKAIHLWSKVWEDRDVLIITGKDSKFILDEELFSTIKSSSFLYTLAEDAFDTIDDIKQKVNKIYSKDTLILISLGPAATILAADLSNLGYQAIDLGHITSSYLNVFKGGKWPENLPVKN